jgi:hypothetical protein
MRFNNCQSLPYSKTSFRETTSAILLRGRNGKICNATARWIHSTQRVTFSHCKQRADADTMSEENGGNATNLILPAQSRSVISNLHM